MFQWHNPLISYTSRSNVVEDYEYRSKIIIKPPVTVRIGVHFPFEHLSGYSVYHVPSEVGLVHHYRFPALYENRAKSPDHRMNDFHSPLLTAIKQKFCLHWFLLCQEYFKLQIFSDTCSILVDKWCQFPSTTIISLEAAVCMYHYPVAPIISLTRMAEPQMA